MKGGRCGFNTFLMCQNCGTQTINHTKIRIHACYVQGFVCFAYLLLMIESCIMNAWPFINVATNMEMPNINKVSIGYNELIF